MVLHPLGQPRQRHDTTRLGKKLYLCYVIKKGTDMINYRSASDTLGTFGFKHTNTCHMDGNTYHDFNARKRDEAISLIVDESTGAVAWIEVTTRKWDDKARRYVPVNNRLTRLQELIDLLKK